MTIQYNPDEDRLRFIFKNESVATAEEPTTGFHFYYDTNGLMVGFDIDEASTCVDDPRTVTVSSGE